MTDRERKLARITIPLLGLAAMYALTKYVVLPPFQDVRQELASLQDGLEEKHQKINFAKKHLARYRTLYELIPDAADGEQTAAKTDEQKTKEFLRDRIDALLTSSGLNAEKIKPPVLVKGQGRGRKKKLDMFTSTIEGRGDLRNAMQFLLDTYTVSDLIHVSSMHFKPDPKQHSNNVKATIKLSTVVIPKDPKLLKLAAKSGGTSGPENTGTEPADDRPISRLAYAMRDYERLLEWRPFDPYEKAVILSGACCVDEDCEVMPQTQCLDLGGSFKGRNSKCTSSTCRGRSPVAEGPTGKGKVIDPKRQNTVVRGFMSDSVLVVENAGSASRGARRGSNKENSTYYDVGEGFDGGTLEFVHRLGVVVRKKDEQDEGGSEKLWVYQLDQPFSDAVLLDDLIDEFEEFRQIRWAMQQAGKQPVLKAADSAEGSAEPESKPQELDVEESSNESGT